MKPLTPKSAAARIGVSQSLIYALLRTGKIPAMRVGCRGKGRWLISVEEFDNWVQTCKFSDLHEEDGEFKYLN